MGQSSPSASRLSLPGQDSPDPQIAEIAGAGIIREVHVYGQSIPVGMEEPGAAQHIGLGGRLIESAEQITRQAGFRRLAVISAVGTRHYYLRQGFDYGVLYMLKELEAN